MPVMQRIFRWAALVAINLGRLHGLGRRVVAVGAPAGALVAGTSPGAAAAALGLTLTGEVVVARWLHRPGLRAARWVLAGACLAVAGALAAALALGWPHGVWSAPILLLMCALMPALPHLESVRWVRANPELARNRPWPALAASRPDHPTGLGPEDPPWTARPLVGLIRAYRQVAPVMPGRRCMHTPTCSQYAEAALTRHGVWRGSWLSLMRSLRCSPLGRGGYDPVPE